MDFFLVSLSTGVIQTIITGIKTGDLEAIISISSAFQQITIAVQELKTCCFRHWHLAALSNYMNLLVLILSIIILLLINFFKKTLPYDLARTPRIPECTKPDFRGFSTILYIL
jgi:hypothetical protein